MRLEAHEVKDETAVERLEAHEVKDETAVERLEAHEVKDETAVERLEAHEVKDETAVERRADGRLWALNGGEAVPVNLVRCFPWSAPGRYLSLRDDDDREVLFVEDPAELDPASREVLAEALHTADFVHEVSAIEELEDDFEIRRWKVRTRQGPRQFQTALESWPREAPNGGLLIEDVAGDLFRIPPAGELDARSRRLVWAFLD